jgi:nucleotide-binding universal stress UspA family protein
MLPAKTGSVKEAAMKILLAVDGSEYSRKAAQYLATHVGSFKGKPELHLLHVKLPIPKGLALVEAQAVLGKDAVDAYYRDEAMTALEPAEDILRRHDIPFQRAYKVGAIAEEIHRYAQKNKIDMIVMGSHGHGALKNLVMGSITNKVLASASSIPVLIVR